MSAFNITEFVKKVIKYLLEGLVVALVAYVIPKASLKVEEIVVIALTAAATFAVLDTFLPSVASSAKNGLGFAIGSSLAGGIRVMG